MPDATTAALDRVARYVLDLHADVQLCRSRDLQQEQAAVEALVDALPDHDGPGRGARYAVVCWVDELFTCRSRWAEAWNENKLESRLYGSNDRAWEFWRQAKLAAAAPDNRSLSAYYLCVALGFRGDWRDEPERLGAWFDEAKARLTKLPQRTAPIDLAPAAEAHRLSGIARLRRMLAVAAVVLLCLAPVAAYVVVQRFTG
ncbi:DotU family type IV/VI secretion system protein [Botrimarina sp.]|uniref:DotU family type IV/VI secretion system protein n=1 Tax=Botrimarina sp. TaxID=2795802 RepID=UPI0032EB3F48